MQAKVHVFRAICTMLRDLTIVFVQDIRHPASDTKDHDKIPQDKQCLFELPQQNTPQGRELYYPNRLRADRQSYG